MSLLHEVEDKYGFWIAKNVSFQDFFTHTTERFIPCSRPGGGRSLWVIECGTKYLIGIWDGFIYVCDNREKSLQIIASLITGKNRMKAMLDSGPAKEIEIYYLLSESMDLIGRSDFQVFPSTMIRDKQIILPVDIILDFFVQSRSEYSIDESNWITFEYAEDNILFRLSPHSKNGMTSVHIGITTKLQETKKHAQFMTDFSRHIVDCGLVKFAEYWGNEKFY